MGNLTVRELVYFLAPTPRVALRNRSRPPQAQSASKKVGGPSVLRRLFRVIYDKDFHGPLPRFQFEPELLLNGLEN